MFAQTEQRAWTLTAALLFSLSMLSGCGCSATVSTAAETAIPASSDNWGLSFPREGETPVGNVGAADLAKYDAYYVGDTSKKMIYLTFDCGYENGNTEKILDTLEKHHDGKHLILNGKKIRIYTEDDAGKIPWDD